MQCNDLKQNCEHSGTFPTNQFGKYAIPGKPEWRAGVSCGLTEQGKYYCIIYNMPCHTWQPPSSPFSNDKFFKRNNFQYLQVLF